MIVLGAYAARSCAVKTHNAFDPTSPAPVREIDEALAEIFEGAEQFEDAVISRLAAAACGRVIDLRLADGLPAHVQSGACAEAMAGGAELIVGGLLPLDGEHHRSGRPDVLVRGEDQADGRPGYHPALIKMHKIHERKKPTRSPRPNASLLLSRFDAPAPEHADEVPGYGFRLSSRDSDLIQLAHYRRMLQDLGWSAPGRPYAGLVGTDDWMGGQDLITWMDLAEPLLRTFSRTGESGWTARSALERYDHEHAFRVDVAKIASQQGKNGSSPRPLVQPIVTDECNRCPWWDHCRSQLADDDVSLRIGKGALDVREIATLRAHGISTVSDLAGVDLDQLFGWYLPEVTHRAGAEERLRQAAHRAKLITTGIEFERITSGPIEVPGAEVEIDFDIETTVDGCIYLWGFRSHRGSSADTDHGRPADGVYHPFAAFDDLDADGERALAVRALSWLRQQAEVNPSIRVYHYSGFEPAALRRLADAHPDEEILSWAVDFAEQYFCDLLPLVKENFFGVNGVGLKPVATGAAGFNWRDDDAGGLNSTRWFVDAVHADSAEQRELARARVLNYNEDDVIATAMVRAWLRGN
ncbi:TM0106 family RecB-like putative nuclease [Microlunatus elymi]|uniref:TM0106 family RecB-like putative nuclease n=1 Tax=Microlunatus elymi TaxID=2596828 RepID=UPI00143CFC6F|nr:TM0106 family RecB-like putative nuclease [Microlunatus elymi]